MNKSKRKGEAGRIFLLWRNPVRCTALESKCRSFGHYLYTVIVTII
jgi:hypothetical protein